MEFDLLAERLRQYIGKANFGSSSDEHSALQCLDKMKAEFATLKERLDKKDTPPRDHS